MKGQNEYHLLFNPQFEVVVMTTSVKVFWAFYRKRLKRIPTFFHCFENFSLIFRVKKIVQITYEWSDLSLGFRIVDLSHRQRSEIPPGGKLLEWKFFLSPLRLCSMRILWPVANNAMRYLLEKRSCSENLRNYMY